MSTFLPLYLPGIRLSFFTITLSLLSFHSDCDCNCCNHESHLRIFAFSPPLRIPPVIRVPPLTLARWPPEGAASSFGYPANCSGPCLGANPLILAGVPLIFHDVLAAQRIPKAFSSKYRLNTPQLVFYRFYFLTRSFPLRKMQSLKHTYVRKSISRRICRGFADRRLRSLCQLFQAHRSAVTPTLPCPAISAQSQK